VRDLSVRAAPANSLSCAEGAGGGGGARGVLFQEKHAKKQCFSEFFVTEK
jgi:hypothetical protein